MGRPPRKVRVSDWKIRNPFRCPNCQRIDIQRKGVHIVCRLCGKVLAEEVRRR